MKAGDKVYVEVEVKSLGPISFRDKRGLYWNNELAITKLPIQEGRWMMVSFNGVLWKKRFVIGKFKDNFVFITSASNDEELVASPGCTTYWKYAKEIPTKRKLTMQEIAEKFNEDVENIEIECQ